MATHPAPSLHGESAPFPDPLRMVALLGVVLFCLSTIHSFASASDPAGLLPPDQAVPGWATAGPSELYQGQDLYKHVDGGADVYLQLGFKQAVVQHYKETERELVVEIYDMGTSSGARKIFAVFAEGRKPGQGIGSACALEADQVLFHRGHYYVAVTAFDTSPEASSATQAFAREVDARIAGPTSAPPGGSTMNSVMELTSTSFAHQGEIPIRHTCEDRDISPALAWKGLPAGARSLALIVDDPDAPDPKAPKMTWVHWVIYNIPPDAPGLVEGVTTKALPPGTLEGTSDFKRTGWGGPCPPIGRHRYFFKLYALDSVLPDLGKPKKEALLKAMEGHIIAQAELIGTYQKKSR
jgi:Raf kinase inhibitor-like YbhB/YbcL family protein